MQLSLQQPSVLMLIFGEVWNLLSVPATPSRSFRV